MSAKETSMDSVNLDQLVGKNTRMNYVPKIIVTYLLVRKDILEDVFTLEIMDSANSLAIVNTDMKCIKKEVIWTITM